jgi:hypothetical protein
METNLKEMDLAIAAVYSPDDFARLMRTGIAWRNASCCSNQRTDLND